MRRRCALRFRRERLSEVDELVGRRQTRLRASSLHHCWPWQPSDQGHPRRSLRLLRPPGGLSLCRRRISTAGPSTSGSRRRSRDHPGSWFGGRVARNRRRRLRRPTGVQQRPVCRRQTGRRRLGLDRGEAGVSSLQAERCLVLRTLSSVILLTGCRCPWEKSIYIIRRIPRQDEGRKKDASK